MRRKLILGICCVYMVLNCCEGLSRCETDEYYVERQNGKIECSPCPECVGGGIGYDTTVILEEDEHGFMTCYPCQECAQGTYRPLNGPSSYCYKCMLDCVHANRYESVHCGGDTEGHCGDCITGHRPESSEPNSRCYPKEDEQLAVVSPVIVTTLKHDIKTEDINEDQPNTDSVKGGSVKQDVERTVILIVVVSFLSLIVISIAIWCLICYCPRSHNATGHDAETPIHSKANLINSSGGSIHTGFDDDLQKEKEPLSEKPIIISIYDETDLSVICLSTGKDEGLEVRKPLLESDNLPRDDLEVDCPGDRKVRGELPSRQLEDIDLPPVQFGKITREGLPPVGTITQEGLPPVGTITQEGLPPVQEEITNQVKTAKSHTYCYYNRPVHEDDETMTVAANGIHGEKRRELFKTYLKLSDSKVSEFDEKWIRNSDNYPLQQNMLDCLKHWLQKYAKEADLKCLLESLKKAGFEDIACEIAQLPENQVPESYPENDENVMYIDLMNKSRARCKTIVTTYFP